MASFLSQLLSSWSQWKGTSDGTGRALFYSGFAVFTSERCNKSETTQASAFSLRCLNGKVSIIAQRRDCWSSQLLVVSTSVIPGSSAKTEKTPCAQGYGRILPGDAAEPGSICNIWVPCGEQTLEPVAGWQFWNMLIFHPHAPMHHSKMPSVHEGQTKYTAAFWYHPWKLLDRVFRYADYLHPRALAPTEKPFLSFSPSLLFHLGISFWLDRLAVS